MTDKEKFRAEIVRLAQLHLDMREAYKAVGNTRAAATENVLYGHDLSILSFIDSMPQEPISENLEQAIDTYLATYWGGEQEKQDWPFLKKMAIHFAEWQKKQLMKDATEGVVICDEVLTHGYKDIAMKIPENLQVNDKVKMIIIKED